MPLPTVEIGAATEADDRWIADNVLCLSIASVELDQAEFWQRFNAKGFATWDTEAATVALATLPDGRIHVYIDPTGPGPLCFTLAYKP